MLIKIAGRVRGLFAGTYPENREDEQLHVNPRGDQLVAQGLPELTELVRLGGSYQGQYATGVAATTAIPTTTSLLTIVNNEPATGKCFLIDSFGTYEGVVDATQTDNTMLMAMLNGRGDTAPSGGTLSTNIRSLSGRPGVYGGAAILRSAATVVNNGWFPHGTFAQSMAAAAAGANFKVNEAQVRGLYLVPPGGAFSIYAVKAAAAAALQQFPYIRWHEVQLVYAP